MRTHEKALSLLGKPARLRYRGWDQEDQVIIIGVDTSKVPGNITIKTDEGFTNRISLGIIKEIVEVGENQ